MSPRLALMAVALVAAAGRPARADAPASAPIESTKVNEAQRRFQRGIELYKEGDTDAALVEFRRAYELVPSYKILYNLGQVAYQRYDYATALRYFRQYLGEGDTAIPAERQHEVAREIRELQQRVGRVELETPEPDAEVFVDDALIGTTPLRAPILVNSGSRKITVVAGSGPPLTRVIDVAGGELRRVSFPRLALPTTADGPRRPPEALVLAAPEPPVAAVTTHAAAVTLPAPAAAVSAPATASKPARKGPFPWKAWALTGLLAGGAAATGVVAYQSKQELDNQLAMFPSDPTEVDYYQRRTRGFALATDGLLIGTAIMAAISVYLTYRDPK